MKEQIEDFSHIIRPVPDDDFSLRGLYNQLELGDRPTLQDLRPYAVDLMRRYQVTAAIGLILGNSLTPREISADEELTDAFHLARLDPERSFKLLAQRVVRESTQRDTA